MAACHDYLLTALPLIPGSLPYLPGGILQFCVNISGREQLLRVANLRLHKRHCVNLHHNFSSTQRTNCDLSYIIDDSTRNEAKQLKRTYCVKKSSLSRVNRSALIDSCLCLIRNSVHITNRNRTNSRRHRSLPINRYLNLPLFSNKQVVRRNGSNAVTYTHPALCCNLNIQYRLFLASVALKSKYTATLTTAVLARQAALPHIAYVHRAQLTEHHYAVLERIFHKSTWGVLSATRRHDSNLDYQKHQHVNVTKTSRRQLVYRKCTTNNILRFDATPKLLSYVLAKGSLERCSTHYLHTFFSLAAINSDNSRYDRRLSLHFAGNLASPFSHTIISSFCEVNSKSVTLNLVN